MNQIDWLKSTKPNVLWIHILRQIWISKDSTDPYKYIYPVITMMCIFIINVLLRKNRVTNSHKLPK